jgi:transcriptional regulator with XRE-family HTH domain
MPDDLWRIRERKKMTVSQLAARAGISAQIILEYENGQPVLASDRARLARALYVDEMDIAVRSQPRPSPQGENHATATPARPTRPAPPPRPPAPARPGQINHLLQLGARLQLTAEQLETEIGKPLAELTLPEARRWLKEYAERIAATSEHPPGYRSRRAHLPEAVDAFELQYLTQAQAAQDRLVVRTFDGETARGTLVGFGTYALTLRLDNGDEVTLQKLAIASYRREAGGAS